MKLLDQCRQTARVKHFSLQTERTYVAWIERYIRFHHIRHPAEMGAPQVEAFLTDLAVTRHVAASTQNQALAAILGQINGTGPILFGTRFEAVVTDGSADVFRRFCGASRAD